MAAVQRLKNGFQTIQHLQQKHLLPPVESMQHI